MTLSRNTRTNAHISGYSVDSANRLADFFNSANLDVPYFASMHRTRYVTPEEFGAVGDDTSDDTQALQDCVNYCLENRLPMCLTAGKVYRTTDMIYIGSTSNIFASFVGGVTSLGFGEAGTSSPSIGAVIHGTNPERPVIAIQGGRRGRIHGWCARGVNTAAATAMGLDSAWVSADGADYVTPGCNDNRYGPHAGWVFDAFCSTAPAAGTGYDGATYGQAATIAFELHECSAANVVAGFVWGCRGSGNSEQITLTRCSVSYARYGFSCGTTQSRGTVMRDCGTYGVHTDVTSRAHGSQNGLMPNILGGIFTFGYRCFDISLADGAPEVSGLYTEQKVALGNAPGSNVVACPLRFANCAFGITNANGYKALIYATLGNAEFDNCEFSFDGRVLNFCPVGVGRLKFRKCYFVANGGAETKRLAIGQIDWNNNRNGSWIQCEDCRYGVASDASASYAENADTYIPYASSLGSRLNTRPDTTLVHVADSGLSYRYTRPPSSSLGVSAVYAPVAGHSWSGNTLTMTGASDPGLVVGDIVYWPPLATSNNPDVPALVPALVVTSKSGSTYTADLICTDISEIDLSYAPSYIATVDFGWSAAPEISLTGTWTTGSKTVTTNIDPRTVLRDGDRITAVGLKAPAYQVRVSNLTATTFDLSQFPDADKTNEPLYWGKFVQI